MKFSLAVISLYAVTAFALPQTSRKPATSNEPAITKTRVCNKVIQDGIGNTPTVPCTEGEAGCNCSDRFTQIRCSRAVQDGTGNVNRESCSQREEGQDDCSCSETVATRTEIRCSRAVQDGTGNVNRESCSQSEEGQDDCSCGESVVLVDSI